MVESIAPRRVRVVAGNYQTFGVCWYVADLERWALVAAELGVNFWYFGVFGESWACDVHSVILARCITSRESYSGISILVAFGTHRSKSTPVF